jgi:integration host factor subunit beta
MKGPGKVTRDKLFRDIAFGAGMSRRDVAVAVDAFLGAVKVALHEGKRVELRGFGAFWPRTWGGRRVTPPGQSKGIRVPGSRTVHFYPGADLRAMRD